MNKKTITAYIMFGIFGFFFVVSLLLGFSNFVLQETIDGIFGSGTLKPIHIIFLVCLSIAVVCGIIGCCNYSFGDTTKGNTSSNTFSRNGEYDDQFDFSTYNSSPYENGVTEEGVEVEFNSITGTMTESSDDRQYERHWDGSVTVVDDED